MNKGNNNLSVYKFIVERVRHMSDFADYWHKLNLRLPADFPAEMTAEDWEVQFNIYEQNR